LTGPRPPHGVLTKSIAAMLENNATTTEILAAHPDRSKKSIIPMVSHLRRKYQHTISVRLDDASITAVYDAAKKRKMRAPDLVAKLLGVLARDKLIDSVLDDDSECMS
jgi:hypothetical protein